jgi:nucleoside-diphosphate kinase
VTERTLVLLKPDAVRRGLVGEVLSRFERKGLVLRAMELRQLDRETAQRHYVEHDGKPFYADLITFITGGPLVAAVIEGDEAISVVRTVVGPTDGRKAPPGTIRGDFSLSNRENLVHASDSAESAARELATFFPDLAG